MDSISITIPCYNEEKRLPTETFSLFLTENQNVNICFSNDGSTDNTLEVLQNLKEAHPKQIVINTLKVNKGKAEAVRQGIILSQKVFDSEFYAYCDADLSTPLHEITRLQLELKNKSKIQFVFGSRWVHLGSKINRKDSRHYLGRIIATAISLTLGLETYDTQCGAKVFRKNIIQSLFKDHFLSPWLFDVELFAKAINLYGRHHVHEFVNEIAIMEWEEVAGSKITVWDGIKSFYYLRKIKTHYQI